MAKDVFKDLSSIEILLKKQKDQNEEIIKLLKAQKRIDDDSQDVLEKQKKFEQKTLDVLRVLRDNIAEDSRQQSIRFKLDIAFTIIAAVAGVVAAVTTVVSAFH